MPPTQNVEVENMVKFWVFHPKGDTINRSGWNMAWNCLPQVYYGMTNLALIGKGVGRGAPMLQNLVKMTVFGSFFYLQWQQYILSPTH